MERAAILFFLACLPGFLFPTPSVCAENARRPTLALVYAPLNALEKGEAPEGNNPMVLTVGKTLSETFSGSGFELVHEQFRKALEERLNYPGRDDERLFRVMVMAEFFQVDTLVLFNVTAEERSGVSRGAMEGMEVEVKLQALSPAFRNLLFENREKKYVRVPLGESASQNKSARMTASQLAASAAISMSVEVRQKLVRRPEPPSEYNLCLSNFPADEERAILDILGRIEGLGGADITERTPEGLLLDLSFLKGKTVLAKEIFERMADRGLTFTTQREEGCRFLIRKEGTESPDIPASSEGNASLPLNPR